MARWIGPECDYIDDVLAAAAEWKERCFLADGSVFTDESLWTAETSGSSRNWCTTSNRRRRGTSRGFGEGHS